MRLKSHVTVGALLRRAQSAGLFAVVAHKGDADGGVVWVKVRDAACAALWSERYGTAEGGWTARTEGFVPEADADAVIARERDFDRDLWVIEVEGAGGADLLA